MDSIAILFAGNLSKEASVPLFNGKNSMELAREQAQKFPGVTKTVLIEKQDTPWTKQSLLDKIAELQAGYDFAYFAFADCPFLDPVLAASLAERHTRFKAEYSYADGWPAGLAPEILAPGTAAILSKILASINNGNGNGNNDNDNLIERDFLFSVIQKDINAFNIEAEISGVDLRNHRLSFCADSKRNLLLLNNFINAAGGKLPDAACAENIIQTKPEILRTLPAFYPIQVYGGCPVKCALCPYPAITDATSRKDYMPVSDFENLLEKISAFSGDAVIDLSLWGELSLHPEKLKLIQAVTKNPGLSLVIETSGIGWNINELEKYSGLSNLSWIVSMDTGLAESESCAKKLIELFPNNCYVQTIRTKGSEDETEKFYRQWKDSNVIIQKYDDFCGKLEKKQASDISPIIRQPCWHIMRDMPILINGTVPLCKSDLENNRTLGNVFNDSLETIWKNGEQYYNEHCKKNYSGICGNCDEYYTYNF
ncbi:MAG: spiro-SPASM protein [Treponema sp.]|jgi:spiro-SPASM protein|nr:spiro-SPASM protein [Treponema sp.]